MTRTLSTLRVERETPRDTHRDTIPDSAPAFGAARAERETVELGALLPSDERFRVLHDLMSVFRTTTTEGFEARAYEVFDGSSDDGLMGVVLALSSGDEVLGVWPLGAPVEAVLGIECMGKGRLDIVVVPAFSEDDEPLANRITVGYAATSGGGLVKDTALRVRYGRTSRLVPKSKKPAELFLHRIRGAHTIELEREDVVHARVFECIVPERDGLALLVQFSDAEGSVRTFDVGVAVGAVARVASTNDQEVIVQGWAPRGGTVSAVVRGLGKENVPRRILVSRVGA